MCINESYLMFLLSDDFFPHELAQPLSSSYLLLSALITLLRNITDESYIRDKLLISNEKIA